MQKDELFHGQYAAEYYDKLMSGEGEAGYLHTKDSYRHIVRILFERMRGLKPDGCFLKRQTVHRLPRIRISPLKMRRFLQAAGFGSVQLLSGYYGKGKPEKLVAVAVGQ